MGLASYLKGWFTGRGNPDFYDYSPDYPRDAFDLDSLTQAQLNVVQHVSSVAARCDVKVEGILGHAWRPIVRPGRFMAFLMRDLMECGNFVAEIEMPPGLRRASYYDIFSWKNTPKKHRYQLTFTEPNGQTVKKLMGDQVCHVMINVDRGTPYEGCSPFAKTGLHRMIENRYQHQANLMSKRYLTSPSPETSPTATDQEKDRQRHDLAMRSKEAGTDVVFVQSQRGTDMKIQHVDLTFAPTAEGAEMRRDLIDELWESISYPKILRAEAPPGVAAKDARAGWIDGWLQSTMSSVAEQLSMALECDVMIDTAPCKVPQVGDQAEIVKTLTEAGIKVEEAKQIAGL